MIQKPSVTAGTLVSASCWSWSIIGRVPRLLVYSAASDMLLERVDESEFRCCSAARISRIVALRGIVHPAESAFEGAAQPWRINARPDNRPLLAGECDTADQLGPIDVA